MENRDVIEKTPAGFTVLDRKAVVLSYQYAFSKQATTNCFIARMGNGQLLVVSPAWRMPEAAFRELDGFGEVGALLPNNGFHHLGLSEWHARYPKARMFASAEAAKRIHKKAGKTFPFEPLEALTPLLGDSVSVVAAPATRCGESWTIAKTGSGSAWYLSDILTNIPVMKAPLPVRLLFKLTNSAPGFRIFHLALALTTRNKKQLLRALLEDLRKTPPTVLIPAHGAIKSGPEVAGETQQLVASAL